MKKLIVTGLLVVSAAGFAANGSDGHMRGQGPRIERQVETLTEAQRTELQAMRKAHRRDTQEFALNRKEVNLKMQRELLKENPDRLTLNKLIDERSKYSVAIEKKNMEHRLEMREKFGIDMKGHHGTGHMGRHGDKRRR